MSRGRIFRVTPLDATFGATVTDLTLADIDERHVLAPVRTWLQYGLLVFPAQHLSNDDQVAFAKRFGALEFGLAPLSNVRADGSVRADEAGESREGAERQHGLALRQHVHAGTGKRRRIHRARGAACRRRNRLGRHVCGV